VIPVEVTTMNESNGTTVDAPVNRLGEAEVKKPKAKSKNAPKSKFREGFEFLRDSDGTKPQASLVRKTEEGSLSLTIKSFPDDPTIEGVQAIAHEEGLKASLKSDVGQASATFGKSLKEVEAEAWVEIVCV
jgi:hypothetical protein